MTVNIFAVCTTIVTTIIAGYALFLLQQATKEKELLRKQKEEAERRREQDEVCWRETVTEAIVQLLRIQLCEYHDKYVVEEKRIPTYAYDNWCRMYKQYKDLGGNGMITHMNEEIESLNMFNQKVKVTEGSSR